MGLGFMFTLALLAAAFVGGSRATAVEDCGRWTAPAQVVAMSAEATELRRLYEAGVPFDAFLEAVGRREDTWRENHRRGAPESAAVARARALPGTWRLLVVAEDWCGDSAHTIPYLARLVAEAPGLSLRIVDSEAGRALMEAHRTVDGRAATPTVLILDERWEEAGCWVERPAPLQAWFQEQKLILPQDELLERKYAWYEEDRGRSTVREVVQVLEQAEIGAAPGACGGG